MSLGVTDYLQNENENTFTHKEHRISLHSYILNEPLKRKIFTGIQKEFSWVLTVIIGSLSLMSHSAGVSTENVGLKFSHGVFSIILLFFKNNKLWFLLNPKKKFVLTVECDSGEEQHVLSSESYFSNKKQHTRKDQGLLCLTYYQRKM